ncbi:MAG: DUF2079 domain-containing protein [Candidatus Omnitrophota bacterium]
MRASHDRISFWITILAAIIWSGALAYKFSYFGFYDWDLSLCSHALWSFSQGNSFSSLYGANPFIDHGYYIALPLSILYKIFPTPLLLVGLKVFMFCAASVMIYRLALIKLPSSIALVMQILFLLFPANVYMMFFEFNFENLAIFLIPLMLFALLKERKVLYAASLFLLCLVKENLPLVVILTGFLALFLKKDDRIFWAGLPILTGFLVFCIGMFVITPLLRSHLPGGAANLYFCLYQDMASQPSSALVKLFSPENGAYLKDLFGAHFPFALLSPLILLAAAPLLLQVVLSNSPTMHTIFFHYAASVAPILFLATIFSLGWLKSRWKPQIFYAIFFLFVLGSVLHTATYLSDWTKKISAWSDPQDKYRDTMIADAPKDRAVITTFDFLSHLVDRKRVYALYNVWKGMNFLTGEKPYLRPLEADLALVDMMDPWLLADLKRDPLNTSDLLRSYFMPYHWQIVHMYDNIALLSRLQNRNDQSPVFIQKAPFKDTVLGSLKDAGIYLEGFDMNLLPSNTFGQVDMPVTFYWGITQRPKHLYFVTSKLEQNNKVLYSNTRLLGLVVCPAAAWLPGEHVRETFVHALPKLSPGEYIYRLSVWDGQSGEVLTWDDSKEMFAVKLNIH